MPGQSPAIVLVALLFVAGCAHDTAQTTTSATAASPVPGDVARGAAVFTKNCSVCHATNASTGGNIGPSLAGEKKKRNYDQTVAWIKQPDPPMPKLFPDLLTDQDVTDVAAYVLQDLAH